MKYFPLVFLAFLLLAAICPTAVGQAAAEAGLGASRAATMTAPARHVGTSLSDLFGDLNKKVDPDRDTTAPAARQTRRRTHSKRATAPVETKTATADQAAAAPPPPAPVYEDPAHIQTGMEYGELVRRFGPPSMSITGEAGSRTLLYSSHGNQYQVQVADGKVVSAPATEAAREAAVPEKP